MFKWVAGLCLTIYAVLLVFGAPPEGEQVAGAVALQSADEGKVAAAETADPQKGSELSVAVSVTATPTPTPVSETTQEVVPLQVASVTATPIDPKPTPSTETAAVAVDNTPAVEPTLVVAPEPEPEPDNGVGEVWTVTGSTVNLRTDATTQAEVIGQTNRGDSAEVIELLENGWARVYILDLGIEAYMSAQFISREG